MRVHTLAHSVEHPKVHSEGVAAKAQERERHLNGEGVPQEELHRVGELHCNRDWLDVLVVALVEGLIEVRSVEQTVGEVEGQVLPESAKEELPCDLGSRGPRLHVESDECVGLIRGGDNAYEGREHHHIQEERGNV